MVNSQKENSLWGFNAQLNPADMESLVKSARDKRALTGVSDKEMMIELTCEALSQILDLPLFKIKQTIFSNCLI